MWILNVHWCFAILLAGVSAQNAPEVSLPAFGRISSRLLEPKIKFEDCGSTGSVYEMTSLKVAGCKNGNGPCPMVANEHIVIEVEFDIDGKTIRLKKDDMIAHNVTFVVNQLHTKATAVALKMSQAVSDDGNKFFGDVLVPESLPPAPGFMRWEADSTQLSKALCFQINVMVVKAPIERVNQGNMP